MGPSSGVPRPPPGFTDTENWEAFDPTRHGVGTEEGYSSVVAVDRHLYFVPFYWFPEGNLTEVLRYRSTDDFSNPASWSTFDLQEGGVADERGYGGAVSDGRYLYLVPANDDGTMHGEVVRYDTEANFTAAASWDAFDPGDHGVGDEPDGYEGNAAFDGRYVYFPPHMRAFGDPRGEVLRYDTGTEFTDADSWDAFDPKRSEFEDDIHGFVGTAFDGRAVYFLPFNEDDQGGLGGEVVRYDTGRPFDDPGSWTAFDPRDHGIGEDGVAHVDAAFDGRFLYLGPQRKNGPLFGSQVVRYDTNGAFRDRRSWADFDPAAAGVGTDPRGYSGVVAKGRYVYFSPTLRGVERNPHGEVLCYDRTGRFDDAEAWTTFDPGANGVGDDPIGYSLATAAGPHVYFAPLTTDFSPGRSPPFEFHSEVLRFDTRGEDSRRT